MLKAALKSGRFKALALLLGFGLVFGSLFLSVRNTLDDIGHAVGNGLGSNNRFEEASRFFTEYQTFMLTLNDYVDGVSPTSHADVKLAFDLLWARTETLTATKDYEFVQAMDTENILFESTKFALRLSDPIIAQIKPGDFVGQREIARAFRTVAPRIGDFAQKAYQTRLARALAMAEGQKQATTKLDRLQSIFALFGLLSLLILSSEIVRVRRMNREISRRESQIIKMGLTDALTGLGNRRALVDELSGLHGAKGKGPGALLLIDLDGFKAVNDNYGHLIGDELLKLAAHRIATIIDESARAFRLGGDEFAIVMEVDAAKASANAEQLINALESVFEVGDRDIYISASIGVTDFSARSPAIAQASIGDADVALYEAKHNGRGCYRVFELTLRDRLQLRNAVAACLPLAIRQGEIEIHFQPQLALASGRIVGVEALARWNHPELGEIGPDIFVQQAEQYGLIKDLDFYVLKQACNEIRRLNRSGADLRLSVNVSPLEAERPGYANELLALVAHLRFPRNRLTLELTENIVMEDSDAVAHNLTILSNAGIKIAIDDFGTGYSNLSYLAKFPFAFLKVDRALASKINEPGKNRAVLDGISHLAANLDLKVVLEGIETDEQLAFASSVSIDEVQGYHIAKPMSAQDLEAFLSRHKAGMGQGGDSLHSQKRSAA